MIEVDGLTKYYGMVVAIEEVSFSVARGEIIGFLGPNGAGKSTTMRILTGFSPATRGTARIDGHDIRREAIAVKRRVGYLPENVPFYPEMTVKGFLHYVAEVKGVPRLKRCAEIGRVMERCGITHMAPRMLEHLSKGYRQRVGLAQALVGDPPVLILDEPTVGLDPRQIVEIRQMIKDLAEDHTVLLSTHILPEVTMICGRVVIIHQGRIVAQESLSNLSGGDGKRFEIEASGGAQRVVEAIRAVPGVRDVNPGGADRFLVEAGGKGVAADVVDHLVKSGLRVSRVQTSERTLEDVFMEAIALGPGGASE